jgi:cell division transport system ATP-binding protein
MFSQLKSFKNMKITFDGVSKSFGLTNALNNINLKIKQGDFIFIAGPSGAGKSTLLKLILGQIKPTSGSLAIDETDMSKAKKHHLDQIRRKVGVIFQDYQLIPDKNIEENIALALDIVNYPKDKIASQIDEVTKKVNLSSKRLLFPSQLSGGELQRTSLARAIAVEPEVILADEPTGNLDPENSWNLVKLLQDINLNTNTTIIMTTHNMDIVDSLDKRTLFLKNGEIVKDTQPPKKLKKFKKKKQENVSS